MGILDFIHDFSHTKEMRESKDQILFGEIVRHLVVNYGPLVELETKLGDRSIAKVRTVKHPIFHSISVTLNRHTGSDMISDAVIGSKAALSVQAEVKNYLADPDDVINMWKTDFANISKIALFGDVKLNHKMNSVVGLVMDPMYSIGDVIDNTLEERKALGEKLDAMIDRLLESLKPYKKLKK